MKTWIALILTLALLWSCIPMGSAAEIEIAAPSAILMDAATGTILFEKNAHQQLPPASVTKVMTLLLVMEALEQGRISWTDTVIASDTAAAKGGSQIYLEPGEQMSLEDMLKSVVVSSANDCATALAEHIAGSEATFVQQMNDRAAELGLQDTHFVNCTGLDDDPNAAEHLTSAHDLAVISRELLRHSEIKKYTTIWTDTVRNGQFGLSNTNKLVRFYEGTTGLKTGYTSAAGYCLSASAQRDGLELIAVVLHCENSTDRFESAKALLNYGFANYALLNTDPDEPLPVLPISLGTASLVTPVLQERAPLLVNKNQLSRIQKTVDLPESLEAPIEKGQQLGTITITAGEQTLSTIPIIARDSVPRLTLWQLTVKLLRQLCMASTL
ncbi:MAG: D-alanyl-D-alanine carboxypeptidase [Oscillospiraceae bacterium]|nr:D-alanyl-D-alanine carboxypeptidase [Oscillospiraceae bacterium]